jgi:DNA-binding MarR family transcriptional regulator
MKRDLLDNLIDDWKSQRPELNASAMGVVGRVLQLGRLLESRAGKALRQFNIHYTDLDVLATLRRSGAPYRLTPTELRRSVLITSGAMTAVLDRLEKSALLRRVSDPADRRVRAVELLPDGKSLIDKAIAVRFDEAEMAVSGLSQDDRTVLADLLRQMILSIEDAPMPPSE